MIARFIHLLFCISNYLCPKEKGITFDSPSNLSIDYELLKCLSLTKTEMAYKRKSTEDFGMVKEIEKRCDRCFELRDLNYALCF